MSRIGISRAGLALILAAVARTSAAAPPAQATGTITGTVTGAAAVPVHAAYVSFLTMEGAVLGSVQTDASGVYISPGLPAGSYYVKVLAPYESGLVDELYNDVPCPMTLCPVTGGTLVPVAASSSTPDIDFSLSPGGWFQGTITNEQTGLPVAEAYVRVYSNAGTVGLAPLTPANGAYRTSPLPPGTYYLEATAPQGAGLRIERYQNVFCEGVACLLTTGTPVSVTAAAATIIDFGLTPGAVITGTVRKAPSNTPLANVRVDFYAANGLSAGASATDASGQYVSPGLPPGSYFLQTETSPSQLVVDELYNDIPCPDRACAQTSGTPVAVSGTGTVGNIDFTLSQAGAISGTVTNAVSGAPVYNVVVRFRTAAGSGVAIAFTRADGSYTSPGLPAGSYYVTAAEESAPQFAGELYDNLPCDSFGCATTGGTLVPVTTGASTSNINFALDPAIPPVITTPPSAVTVWEGQIATFTAAATGLPPAAVQWQASTNGGVTWSDVSGATDDMYTFATVRADNGKQVRALFSNRAGSATTGPAMLTVHPCDFLVSSAASAPHTGSSGAINVQTGAGCAWVAVSNMPWLMVTSGASAVGNGSVTYTVAHNPASSSRSGSFTIAGHTVAVTQFGVPTMALDRTFLAVAATTDGSAFVAATPSPTLRLTQSAPGEVTWTAESNRPWLTVSPSSGTGPATLTVVVAFAPGLSPGGTADGALMLTFAGAANSSVALTVSLTVLSEGESTQPFGRIDTPLEGATGISGSIAVTGWALDDVGVTRVRILRDPVEGEGSSPIYIGDASFVDGARPDVQAVNPAHPQSTRGGWGYLMLTNFLPRRGNGTFTLHAEAVDVDGHAATIGSRTITCDNAASIAPFGAIDTPGQGETVSGAIVNFGWVMSPGSRRADPPGGGIVRVFIDGADIGSPLGWSARSDISALFPLTEYEGANNALGALDLDTTALANGVHTLAWVVTATSGGSAGVGSRYFTVSNSASLRLDPPHKLHIASDALADIVNGAPADPSTIHGRRGFDLESALTAFAVADGRITVQAEELDRIELRLSRTGGHSYTGYLRTIDGLRPLPAGSALDPATGTFTWGVGPGFVGTYDLSFVRWDDGPAVARQDVRVVLNPKGSDRLGPQVVIDVPAPGRPGEAAVVGRTFFLSGWAIDLDSAADGGVSTVHVWAYPLDAKGAHRAPVFLGPAMFGGARADVAAVYGSRFEKSGYGTVVTDLAPGTYDVAVFAFSTPRADFVPAKVVRVTVR